MDRDGDLLSDRRGRHGAAEAPSRAAVSRFRRLGTVLGAMMDGVGLGLTAALIMLVAASAVAWLRDLIS